VEIENPPREAEFPRRAGDNYLSRQPSHSGSDLGKQADLPSTGELLAEYLTAWRSTKVEDIRKLVVVVKARYPEFFDIKNPGGAA